MMISDEELDLMERRALAAVSAEDLDTWVEAADLVKVITELRQLRSRSQGMDRGAVARIIDPLAATWAEGIDPGPEPQGLEWSDRRVTSLNKADAILSALQPPASVPEGWKLVPVEPTEGKNREPARCTPAI